MFRTLDDVARHIREFTAGLPPRFVLNERLYQVRDVDITTDIDGIGPFHYCGPLAVEVGPVVVLPDEPGFQAGGPGSAIPRFMSGAAGKVVRLVAKGGQ